jgi:hypothetical protein
LPITFRSTNDERKVIRVFKKKPYTDEDYQQFLIAWDKMILASIKRAGRRFS